MPSILNLKFKGNKSFVAFSNLADADSLTKTWKVCTKVASYLEQGQRLENLSWRLWHLQNLMVDTDNAKSKREFKKLSKHMGDKLDKEKGRSIEELQAPGFRRNQSTDMIQLRAAEKERNRLASLHATPGTIKRMQFTFSVEQPSGSSEAQPLTVAKPDLKPSSEFKDGSHKRSRPNNAVVPSSSSSARQATTSSSSSHTTPTPNHSSSSMSMDVDGMDQPLTQRGMKPLPSASQPAGDGSYSSEWPESGLRFPSLFSNDFGPTALLNPSPSVRGSLSYGEDVVATLSSSADAFGVVRPTLELPLDDILSTLTDSPEPYTFTNGKMDAEMFGPDGILPYDLGGQEMYGAVDTGVSTEHVLGPVPQHHHQQRQQQTMSPPPVPSKEPKTVSPSKLGTAPPNSLGEQPRPRLTLKTSSGGGSRGAGNAGLGATASAASSTNGTGQSSSSSNGKSGTSSAPGGVKAECSNCGATHTPLWRRGLNDELNCNACGLYCKLHKRPRPKSMRNNHNSSSSNNTSSSAASSSSASQSDSRAHGSSASARAAAQAAQAAQPDATQESMGAGSMGHVGRARSGSASLVGTGSAQCYNCHTTTTPLWRKDDEGKTVCNACGLYYKLHGSARPISMKSDVIRKRSRHDAARRSIAETPSASPGASRRNSPVGDNGVATVSTPTFAPDSTTQVFDYEFQPAQSELMGALGDAGLGGQSFGSAVAVAAGLAAFGAFPGPYHPDYLMKNYGDMMSVYATGGASSATTNHGQDEDGERANKRRRMSNVSTTSSSTDPPLSAASSYSSYESAGYASSAPTSVSSSRSSGSGLPGSGNSSASGSNGNGSSSAGAVDFPYAQYNSYGLMRAAGPSAFWHPPMLPQTHSPSASFVHPPMLPPSDDSDYGYGQQQQQQAQQQQQQQQQQAQQNREDVDGLFSTYLHPPMILPESPELGGGLTSLHGLKGVHPPMLPPDYADMQTGY